MSIPRGRKTKLTVAIQQAIVNAVAGGVPYLRAAVLAGVVERTAYLWRERGEGTNAQQPSAPLYVHFVQAVKKAEAQDEARRLLRINQAGQGGTLIARKTITYPDGRVVTEEKHTSPDWCADAWHLERKWPEQYGRRDRVDVHMAIERVAARVAAEATAAGTPMTKEEVVEEAERLLRAADREAGA